ncbi:hypothetical protein UlMin_010305 [Ulmus minor]
MGLFDGLPVSPNKGYLGEDLSQIDESWAAARFDSLPHVVHILTSKDREGEVRFLKEQSDIIEEVVDDVILRFYSHYMAQDYWVLLALLHLSSMLKMSFCLTPTWSLVPARIEKLITEKHFYAAVQLHVQSTLMLEREGLQTVGALQDVRSELTKLRGVLFYKILDELHAHLYNKGEYSSSINENDDEVRTTTAVALSMNNSQPLSRRTRLLKGDNQFGVHGDGLYRLSSIDGGINGGEGYSKEVKIVPRQMPTWILYSTPNEFLETMQKSDAPLHVKYLQTMVECLCMLGKVVAAGVMICQQLRPTIHEVITSKIKAHAKLVNSSRYGVGQTARSVIPGLQFMKGHLESYQLPKQKRQNGISLARTLLAVNPVSHVMAPIGKAQAAAKELLDSILDTVVRIFENHVVVGEILELKSASSDMNTPKSMSIDGNWNPDSEASQVTGGYSIGFSLTVLQILRATPEAASADAAVQTAKLASKVPSKGKRDGAEDGLTFAFHFTDASISIPNQGVDLIRQGWSKKGPIIQEGYGSFTDKVASMLPMKYSQLGNDGLLAFTKKYYIKCRTYHKPRDVNTPKRLMVSFQQHSSYIAKFSVLDSKSATLLLKSNLILTIKRLSRDDFLETMKDDKKREFLKKAYNTLILSLSDNVMREIVNWLRLKAKFFTWKMKEGRDLQGHIHDFNKLIVELSNIGVEYDDEDKALVLLYSLSKKKDLKTQSGGEVAFAENAKGYETKLKKLRTDNGLEFLNFEFDQFCRDEGIFMLRKKYVRSNYDSCVYVKWILGMEIIRDREQGMLFVTQYGYLRKMWKVFPMLVPLEASCTQWFAQDRILPIWLVW